MTLWASHFIDDADGLVHLADDHYGAKMNGPHPEMAFTRCGHVIAWNGVRANAGAYVSVSTVLTCVRCAGGARDGRARRSELKNAMFMEMYGRPANKVIGPYAAADVALTLALFSPRSVLRKCARLAAVFYLKAAEAPSCTSECPGCGATPSASHTAYPSSSIGPRTSRRSRMLPGVAPRSPSTT